MKKYIICLECVAVILSMSSMAFSDEWTLQDTILQVSIIGLIAVDWMQTLTFIEEDGYYETNPILGKYPSRGEVNVYCAASILITTGIAYILPKPYRTIYQSIAIGVEMEAVKHNYQIGVRINF